MSRTFKPRSFILTPPHIVNAIAQSWFGISEVLLPPYFTKYQPAVNRMWVSLKAENWKEYSSAAS